MIGVHVFDYIYMDNEKRTEFSNLTEKRLEPKPHEYDNVSFASITVPKQGQDYPLHSKLYASLLMELSLDWMFK